MQCNYRDRYRGVAGMIVVLVLCGCKYFRGIEIYNRLTSSGVVGECRRGKYISFKGTGTVLIPWFFSFFYDN